MARTAFSLAEHVVCTDGGGGKCLHCGEELEVRLPQRVSVVAATWKAFIAAHRRCHQRDAGAPSAKPSKE